jgi:hypothetical protein
MAESGKKISAYPILTAPTSNTKLVVSHNGNTYSISVNNLFANNANTVAIPNLVIPAGNTPANSTVLTGLTAGRVWHDGTYIYLASNSSFVVRLGSFASF